MGRPRLGRTDSVDAPVTPETKTEFKEACQSLGLSMTDVVNDLITGWLAKQAKRPKQQTFNMPITKAS